MAGAFFILTNILIDVCNDVISLSVGPHGGLELILDAQQYEYTYYYFQDNFGAGL